MADSYLEFSEMLADLSAEEASWLKNQLEVVHVIDGKEYPEDDLPAENASEATWTGCRAYRDMDDYDPDYSDVGFEYELQDDDEEGERYLWIYSQDNACLEQVAHLVQKFLRRFRPADCWSLTYSITCSKPRVGEFGGGAIFVTATDVKWLGAWCLVEEQQKEFNRQESIAQLVDKANKLGLHPEDLDEAVHDAADSLAATINNEGVDKQVAWLIDQLGLSDTEACIAEIAEQKSREGVDNG